MTGMWLQGINRVTRTLATGRRVEYHYIRNTGRLLWKTGDPNGPGTPAYHAAWQSGQKGSTAPAVARNKGLLRQFILEFQVSTDYKTLSTRQKADYLGWFKEVDKKFGAFEIDHFEDPRILDVVLKWRDQNSEGRAADNYFDAVRRAVTWAVGRKKLAYNHLPNVKDLYVAADRSEIIWNDDDLEAFFKVAPDYHCRP